MEKDYLSALVAYFLKYQQESPSIRFYWNEKNKQLTIPEQNKKENKVIFEATSKAIFVIQRDRRTRFWSWFSAYKAVTRAFDYCNYNIWINGAQLSPPKLSKHEISICHIETNTGIVLTIHNNRYFGWGEVFHVCENQKQAEEYVNLHLQQSSDISFVLRDAEGNAKEVGPF